MCNIDFGDLEELQDVCLCYLDFLVVFELLCVFLGDNFVVMIFWYGVLFNDWVNDWMLYFMEGDGNFVILVMEDIGMFQVIVFLENVGCVCCDCVMVLCSGSNFIMQLVGVIVVESLVGEKKGSYFVYLFFLEVLWKVGSFVVEELIVEWECFENEIFLVFLVDQC